MAAVEEPKTQVRAEAKYVRTAPRKAQLVVSEIRGLPVGQAKSMLAFMTRAAARDVERVLASAVANAEANHDLVAEDLYVSAAYIGAGPTLKRWRPRARGRVNRIKKRTCHITILVAPIEGAVEARAARKPPAVEEKPKRVRKPKAEAVAAAPAVEETPVVEETPAVEPEAEVEAAPAVEETPPVEPEAPIEEAQAEEPAAAEPASPEPEETPAGETDAAEPTAEKEDSQ